MTRFVPAALGLLFLASTPGLVAAQARNRIPSPPRGSEESWPNLFVSGVEGGQWLEVDSVQIEDGLGTRSVASVQGRSTREIAPERLVGRRLLVGIRTGQGAFRFFHGYVSSATVRQGRSDENIYSLRVAPWPALLRQVATCAVFEELTIPQIVERVFARHRFAEYQLRLGRNYPVRALEVQYRESDLNFVNRLLEHEGIYAYVEHRVDGHRLILSDGTMNRPSGPALRAVRDTPGPDTISSWERSGELKPTRYTLADYVYESGNAAITGTATIRNRRGGELEIFDYPGEYRTRREANRYAQMRLDEIRNTVSTYRGRTTNLAVSAGDVIAVDGDRFFVTQVQLSTYGQPGSGEVASVSAIPASRRYRPSRRTAKPMVSGVQSATVTAVEPGERGRVRVRFHWDRSVRQVNGAWLRVARLFSADDSPRRPRVGEEVLVAFREGDPNRPLVVGLLQAAARDPR